MMGVANGVQDGWPVGVEFDPPFAHWIDAFDGVP